MKPVEFHPEARVELIESARFYEAQRPGLGRRFASAVRDAAQRIQTYPSSCRIVEDDFRQCRVLRFPYALVYRVRAGRVEIVAVMHLHREPGYRRSRLARD